MAKKLVMLHAPIATLHLCVSCNKKLQEMINSTLAFPDVLIPLSSFIAVGSIALVFYLVSGKRARHRSISNPYATLPDPVPLTFAALILGMGIG